MTNAVCASVVVPKLSLRNGLVYVYSQGEGDTDDPWYLTAIDFRTGEYSREILWRTPAGKSVRVRSTRMVSLTERHLAAIGEALPPHGVYAVLVDQHAGDGFRKLAAGVICTTWICS